MIHLAALVTFLFLSPLTLLAQQWVPSTDAALRPPAVAREFRGAWVATVANIDWPSAPGLPVETLRSEMLSILDSASRIHLNALVLQVRPSCDAIYPSTLEPWSEYLTGQSGTPPVLANGQASGSATNPVYDPLAEWVRESHARGIELHAWFNPFRARHFRATKPDAPTHITNTRPDLVRSYDNYLWLDPGEPDAEEHSLRVILDVVARYNIDGVHIDDYFYPYPKGSVRFPDETSYAKYVASRQGAPTLGLEDWRRDNINRFVRRLGEDSHRLKPFIKVGISPFGIWRPGSPPGIAGFDAYDKLAADARLWLREGLVDYFAPQLYWPIEQRPQSYTRLLDWWIANNDHDRHLWIGNNASRVLPARPTTTTPDPADTTPDKSWEPDEIVRQIAATRATNLGPGGGSGNILFSMIALTQNRRGLADALLAGPYAQPALVPASPWLATAPNGTVIPLPSAPAIAGVTERDNQVIVTIAPPPPTSARMLIQGRYGTAWRWVTVPATQLELPLAPSTRDGELNAIAISCLDAAGREGAVMVLERKKP